MWHVGLGCRLLCPYQCYYMTTCCLRVTTLYIRNYKLKKKVLKSKIKIIGCLIKVSCKSVRGDYLKYKIFSNKRRSKFVFCIIQYISICGHVVSLKHVMWLLEPPTVLIEHVIAFPQNPILSSNCWITFEFPLVDSTPLGKNIVSVVL